MYEKEDLLPSNRNYTLLIGCFTFIFTIIVLIVTFSMIRPVKENEVITTVVQTTTPLADITKYNQDSDNDLIPNFIEDEAILNTFISETSYCEQSNPKCGSGAFDNTFYITVLIDSSTSMNIPARRNLTKIELLKNELIQILNENINESFVRINLLGFGNKGSLSFIADNESCVSNYNFKNFNQQIRDTESTPLVLNNLFPNGKSPIGYTLEQAERNFPERNGNNMVIILTDGYDDCGGNLNETFKATLSRGVVKKINVVSLYSPQDENQKLREATESNGGNFTTSDAIKNTFEEWKKDFILTNWCKFKDQNKVFQCIDKNYSSAFSTMDSQVNSSTPSNEINKIR
jgi:hypothetical protein